MKNKKITVEVDPSTWRWLRALARANSQSDIHPYLVTESDLLAQAAFCFADAAGRRTGSWEADVAQRMLDSSGFQEGVRCADYYRCKALDAHDSGHSLVADAATAAWRASRSCLGREPSGEGQGMFAAP